MDDLERRIEKIEQDRKRERREIAPILLYVNSKMDSEKELSDLIKEVRHKLASDGLRGAVVGAFILMAWGAKSWIEAAGG